MDMVGKQDRSGTVVVLTQDLRWFQVLVQLEQEQKRSGRCFHPDSLNYTVEYTLYSHLRA